MTACRGTFGEVKVFEDFTNFEDNIAATGLATGVVYGTGFVSVGNVGLVSVAEGSLAWTIDEPGGILAITTDTGDNENACLIAGRFQPSLGGCETEARFKFDSITLLAIYAGFTETMVFDTPVMPVELNGTTVTYNGTGGMIGAYLDPAATDDDFRAAGADGGSASSNADTLGTRANETLVVDEWYICCTEMDPDGNGRVYVGHKGEQLDLIAVSNAVQGTSFLGAIVTPTDQQYAVLLGENRSGAARVLEVDYIYGHGWRDWTVA